MAKNVTVWLSDGDTETYKNVNVVEDRQFQYVTAIRLYDGETGILRAKFDYGLISRIRVEDSN
jgi:hypothetical protein